MHFGKMRADAVSSVFAKAFAEFGPWRPFIQRQRALTFGRADLEPQCAVLLRHCDRSREFALFKEGKEIQLVIDIADISPGLAPDAQGIFGLGILQQVNIVHAAIEQEAADLALHGIARGDLLGDEAGMEHRMRDNRIGNVGINGK